MQKLLLVHGWDYKHYSTQTSSHDAWDNRRKFVDELAKIHELKTVTLPGFCGEKDTATPPQVLLDKVPKLKNNIAILANGTHDIANTNTAELISEIYKFTSLQ